jgi:hypothetical protein
VLDIEIKDAYTRLLAGERADDFHPDAGGSAGDDDAGSVETGVDGERAGASG